MSLIPVLIRTGFLAAKAESAQGTAIAVAGSDAGWRVMNPRFNPKGDGLVIANATGLGDMVAIPGAYSAEMDFDLQLYGTPSTVPTAKWPALLLPACGFVQSGTSASQIFTFSGSPTDWKTLTMSLHYGTAAGAIAKGLFGAMGMISSLKIPTGGPATASMGFRGCYNPAPTPGSTVGTFSFESSTPPVFAKTGALTIGADTTVAVDNVEVTMSDYVILIQSPNAAGGFLQAYLKKPDIRVKCSPLGTAAKDYINDFLAAGGAGTPTTITAVLDGGAGNKISIYCGANNAQLAGMPENGNRDELRTDDLTFAILNNDLRIKLE